MSNRLYRLFLVAVIAGLAACQPAETATPMAPTARPATPAPTATDKPTATASASPSPAPTVAPTADLDWLLQSQAAEAQYRIPLLARHVSEEAVYLQYAFPQDTAGEAVVWPADRTGQPIRVALPGLGGSLQVGGLSSGRTYEASLVVDGSSGEARRPTLEGEIWPPIRFATQSGGPPFTAAVFGDSGFGDSVTSALVQRMATLDLDFSLHTGDLVYRVHENPDPPTAFIEKLYQPLGPLLAKGPIYPVPGNHEYDRPTYWQDEPYYLHAFPPLPTDAAHAGEGAWYSFSYGGVQFVMLDSQVLFGVPGASAQETWLTERLADDSYRYSVVVMHVPPYTVGRHTTDSRRVASRWADHFEAASVPLVLSGHDHNYQRFLVEDTTYVVTGGGSAVTYSLRGSDPRLREGSSRPHFVVLSFERDRIVLEASDQAGIIFDRTVIPVPPPADG